jgi:hypothetical protein
MDGIENEKTRSTHRHTDNKVISCASLMRQGPYRKRNNLEGAHTDRQQGYLRSLVLFFEDKERRTKTAKRPTSLSPLNDVLHRYFDEHQEFTKCYFVQ